MQQSMVLIDVNHKDDSQWLVDENVDQTQENYEWTSCRSEFATHFLLNARVDI